jgi:hypothetical protein
MGVAIVNLTLQGILKLVKRNWLCGSSARRVAIR